MRPKIQEGETYRADGGARGCLGRGNVGRRRNASQGYDPDALPLPLVIKEKERFILHNGAAKRTAELVVMKRSFWSPAPRQKRSERQARCCGNTRTRCHETGSIHSWSRC